MGAVVSAVDVLAYLAANDGARITCKANRNREYMVRLNPDGSIAFVDSIWQKWSGRRIRRQVWPRAGNTEMSLATKCAVRSALAEVEKLAALARVGGEK